MVSTRPNPEGKRPKGCNLRPRDRARSDQERAVALDLRPVHVDGATTAQVADEVPVHSRLVDAAGLRVAGADRHVHRATDLLVKQDLLRTGRDPVIGADAELAEPARSVVGVED